MPLETISANAKLVTKQKPLPNPKLALNIDIDDVTHFLLELDVLKCINPFLKLIDIAAVCSLEKFCG